MSIKFVKARRIEELETEANKLIAQDYWPLEGGFLEETNPDTTEKFILLMVKRPAAVPPSPVAPPGPVTPPERGGGGGVTPLIGRVDIPIETGSVKKKTRKTKAGSGVKK